LQTTFLLIPANEASFDKVIFIKIYVATAFGAFLICKTVFHFLPPCLTTGYAGEVSQRNIQAQDNSKAANKLNNILSFTGNDVNHDTSKIAIAPIPKMDTKKSEVICLTFFTAPGFNP
jgi:hypothetical protein